MRVLILGGGGMLGHKLVQSFRDRFETWVTVRSSFKAYERFAVFGPEQTIGGVDALDFGSIIRAIETVRPDVVVNAIGVIKQLLSAQDPIIALTINSLLPHKLAAVCVASGCRSITLSTDCVFNGKRGLYTEDDISNAEDLYGRTKYLGEVTRDGCLTIRSSIIGRELDSSHSLVEWFLSNRGGKVRGFTNAIYTGLPTITMAKLIANVIQNHTDLNGLYQVSSAPISKYDLLLLMRDAYGVQIEIEPDADYQIDRSLDSARFRRATGFEPASWPDLVNEMASDPTPYDDWRRTSGT